MFEDAWEFATAAHPGDFVLPDPTKTVDSFQEDLLPIIVGPRKASLNITDETTVPEIRNALIRHVVEGPQWSALKIEREAQNEQDTKREAAGDKGNDEAPDESGGVGLLPDTYAPTTEPLSRLETDKQTGGGEKTQSLGGRPQEVNRQSDRAGASGSGSNDKGGDGSIHIPEDRTVGDYGLTRNTLARQKAEEAGHNDRIDLGR